MSKEKELEAVRNTLKGLTAKEAYKEFAAHQPFVLSGLNSEEEFKSRMAFVDAYKKEFAEIHAEIKKFYKKEGAANEFDYLAENNFRKVTGNPKVSKNPLKDGTKVYLLDMMKDYMTYQHLMGEVSDSHYNSFLAKETEQEKEFRKQSLSKKDRDFLIEESPFSEQKKQGIRECRKWMYRNASKSGIFNETGSKRNYIDTFAKKPVQMQVNALFQVENGLYKYEESLGVSEKNAMDSNYVPDLKAFKEKMVRTKKNPYNLYRKVVGEFYIWSRLERAVRKTDSRANMVDKHFKEALLEDKLNRPVVPGKGKEPTDLSSAKRRYRIINPVGDAKEANRVNAALKKYAEERNKYLDLLGKFRKDRSDDSVYKKLVDQGNKIQRFVKVDENKRALLRAEQITGENDALSRFVDFVVKVQKNRKVEDAEIDKILGEKTRDGIDLGLMVKGFADKAYSLGSGVAGMATSSNALAKVSKGFSFGVAVSSAYTTLKAGVMSLVSWRRKKKVVEAQKENKENTKADEHDIESRKLNDMAKVSKKRNAIKTKNYAYEGGFAAAAVGFTTLGLVGITCLPLTIASAAVGTIGFGVKYAMDYYQRKSVAKKSLDSVKKTEEYAKQTGDNNDIREVGNSSVNHKRYIDKKAEERINMLEEKQGRFAEGQSSWKVLDTYKKSPDKVKNRIRENWAVEKGNVSIYSFSDAQDKENVMEAYRHMFLKNPEGPIDANNLLTPAQVKLYMSTATNDLKKTGQTREQAKRRALYKDVLQSEGIETSSPKSLEEAKRRIKAKEKKEELGNQEANNPQASKPAAKPQL